MGVSLSKGGNVSLTKAAPGLTAVVVGLGWDVRIDHRAPTSTSTPARSWPAPTGKVVSDEHFVFFNNLTQPGRLGRAHRATT